MGEQVGEQVGEQGCGERAVRRCRYGQPDGLTGQQQRVALQTKVGAGAD